jgi:hypothetical protein
MKSGLIAFVCFLIASGLAVAAVYVLAGMGWALLAGAVPFLVAAGVIMRGLRG